MNKKEQFTKNTYKLLLTIAKEIKNELLLGMLLSSLFMLLSLLGPIVLKRIIDSEIDAKIGIINTKNFIILSFIYLLVAFLTGLFNYIHVKHYKKTSNKAGFFLRKKIFNHITDLPISFFDRTAVGKISSRITGDVNEFKQLFYIVFTTIFNSILFLIGSIIYIAITNPTALYIVIIPIPIFIFVILAYNKYQASLNIKYRRLKSNITSSLNEIIKGTNIIQTFVVCDPVLDEFIDDNNKLYRYGSKIELFDSFFSYNITTLLSDISMIIILYFTGLNHLEGNSSYSIGYILILIQYINKIYQYLNNTMNRLTVFEKGMSGLENINTILEEKVEIDGSKYLSNMIGTVEFKNVYHEYLKGSPVLENISFHRKAGSSTALVGSTGSGKSSIVSLLFKFYTPYKGQITIDGIDINHISTNNLRDNMALVLQDPALFKGSLRYNITLGEKFTDEEIIEALITSGGEHILNKLKEGLDTNLLGTDTGLSLGEKQIVNFARTIIRRPKILVLDEATASIDSETELYIQKGLRALMKGRTSFIIAHRLSTIKDCDSIIVLDKGKIMESGSHEELMKLKGNYYNLVKSQK